MEILRCGSLRQSRAVAWLVSRLDSGSRLIRVQVKGGWSQRVPRNYVLCDPGSRTRWVDSVSTGLVLAVVGGWRVVRLSRLDDANVVGQVDHAYTPLGTAPSALAPSIRRCLLTELTASSSPWAFSAASAPGLVVGAGPGGHAVVLLGRRGRQGSLPARLWLPPRGRAGGARAFSRGPKLIPACAAAFRKNARARDGREGFERITHGRSTFPQGQPRMRLDPRPVRSSEVPSASSASLPVLPG